MLERTHDPWHPCAIHFLLLLKSFDFLGHHWWENIPPWLLSPSWGFPAPSLGKEDYWLQTINFEQSIGKDQGFMWGWQSYSTIKICIVPIFGLVFIWGKPLNNNSFQYILIPTGSPDKPQPALDLLRFSQWMKQPTCALQVSLMICNDIIVGPQCRNSYPG